MNSYSYQGLGKPKNIKRDLSPEKMEILQWLVTWDKRWKEFCKTLHVLYVIQTIRYNKFPILNEYEEPDNYNKMPNQSDTKLKQQQKQALTRRERKLKHLKQHSLQNHHYLKLSSNNPPFSSFDAGVIISFSINISNLLSIVLYGSVTT